MSLKNKQTWLAENNIKVAINPTPNPMEDEQIVVYQKDRKTMEWKPLKQTINVKNHKYGKQCIYVLVFPWDFEHSKRVTMTLQRLVYLQFKGDIPESYDVDHIDGDSLNNIPSNLQAISRKENLKKRELSHKEIAKRYRDIERNIKNSQQNPV